MAYTLLIFISISLAMISLGTYIRGQQVLTSAEELKQKIELNQLNTVIYVKDIYLSGNLLYVTISNNGSTTLYAFKYFDVIVKYYANISNVPTLLLSRYNYSNTLGPYTWISQSIVINPNTVGTFIINLPYPPYPNTQATIVIASNYGPKAVWSGAL
ncbi:MAG: hypothetical protein QXF46_09040 [Thermofilaceae archaeon]|nr:flagellar protein F [Candidatus Rehaiarchaeum fermentans]